MKTSPHTVPSLLTLILLAGCGGHHHNAGNGGGGSSLATDIVLTVGTGYNGSSADLTGTPTLNPEAAAIEVVLNDGGRLLVFLIPSSSLTVGGTITAAQGGFAYTETGGNSKYWDATTGSVTITSIANGKANATVNGLQFSPSTTVSGNTAAGTFTANGTVVGLPVTEN